MDSIGTSPDFASRMQMQDPPNNQPQEPPPFLVNGKPLTCGMRFSVVDAVTLIVGAGVTVWAWAFVPDLALVVPFLLMHFFLFCNVFRVSRRPELIWSVFRSRLSCSAAHQVT